MILPRNITAHTGLRGIAALVVLMAHLQIDLFFPNPYTQSIYLFLNWSHEAVDLFFVLSGFILAHVYGAQPKIHWRSYFVARFARIYPLAVVTLLFVITLDLYSALRHHIPSPNLDPSRILNNLFLLNGLYSGFHNSINGPAWSLSVEAFLYVSLFPLLIWSLNRFPKKSSLCWWILGAGGSLLLMTCKTLPWTSIELIPETSICLFRGLFGFTAGFSIRFILSETVHFNLKRMTYLEMTTVAAVLLILATGLPPNFLAPLFFILVLCTATNETPLSKILSHPLLSYLGERSYSIYLIHLPLKEFFCRLILWPSRNSAGEFPDPAKLLMLTFSFLGAFILAELSYRYFETPLRQKLRQRLGDQSS